MTTLDIKNLTHLEKDVAKHIKSTKKQFIWEFVLDGKSHKIELFDSRLSGKKKVLKDGLILMQTEENVAFIKTFDVGKHNCTLIQHGDKYELRIDNQSFNHLMDLERNKVHFKRSEPTSNTRIIKQSEKDQKKIGFGLSIQNISKPNDPKPTLFSFSIKPATDQNSQPKRFNFSTNDGNKELQAGKINPSVKSLIEIPENIQDINFNKPKESKSNVIDIMGDVNQDLFDIVPSINDKNFLENKGTDNFNLTLNNKISHNKNNDLMNAIENIYNNKDSSIGRAENTNLSQQPSFNNFYGVPQIGDGNQNYEYNPYMNNSYGQMHPSLNQIDSYNKYNPRPYNYSLNNQNDNYGNNTSMHMGFNLNNQSHSDIITYPSIQSSNYGNISRSDLNSMNSKNPNKDPLAELFG